MSGPSKINNEGNIPRAVPTLARLFFHADPDTGFAKACKGSELAALFSALVPAATFANQAALLAGTTLPIGYFAFVADTGSLYLYNGPAHNSIANYTILNPKKFRGAYDASSNQYPAAGGSTGGDPQAGDEWHVSVAGILDLPGLADTPIEVGALLKALVNSPGQTPANWKVIQ